MYYVYPPLKRGFKRLSGLYAAFKIREVMVSFFDVTIRLVYKVLSNNLETSPGTTYNF